MNKLLITSLISAVVSLIVPASSLAQTPTIKVPLCLIMKDDTKQYVPCNGVVPIDSSTGNALSWTDLFDRARGSGGGGTGGTGIDNSVTTGSAASKSLPVQNSDGTKLATDSQLITTNSRLFTLTTNLGSPFQAGGQLGNTFFGARLQDANGSPFGTSNNPVFVSGGAGGGGSSTITSTAGTANTNAVPVQSVTGAALATDSTINSLFKSGQSIGNTAFGATQSGTWNIGTVTSITNPVNIAGPVSNVVQVTPTNRSALVGLSAITIMPTNNNRKGMAFQNQSSTAECYINTVGTATADQNSLLLGPGGYFEPDHHVTTGTVSIVCAADNTRIYAREW